MTFLCHCEPFLGRGNPIVIMTPLRMKLRGVVFIRIKTKKDHPAHQDGFCYSIESEICP